MDKTETKFQSNQLAIWEKKFIEAKKTNNLRDYIETYYSDDNLFFKKALGLLSDVDKAYVMNKYNLKNIFMLNEKIIIYSKGYYACKTPSDFSQYINNFNKPDNPFILWSLNKINSKTNNSDTEENDSSAATKKNTYTYTYSPTKKKSSNPIFSINWSGIFYTIGAISLILTFLVRHNIIDLNSNKNSTPTFQNTIQELPKFKPINEINSEMQIKEEEENINIESEKKDVEIKNENTTPYVAPQPQQVWVNCFDCQGRRICIYCNGDGWDFVTNGSNEIISSQQCPICHGNKMCIRCGGTGGHYETRF